MGHIRRHSVHNRRLSVYLYNRRLSGLLGILSGELGRLSGHIERLSGDIGILSGQIGRLSRDIGRLSVYNWRYSEHI